MFGIKTKILDKISKIAEKSYKSPKNKNIYTLAKNKKYSVKIPTYDGSGQVVHPDILIQETAPYFVLAFTPYPNTNDFYENPSLAVSDDGLIFYEEQQGLNPLAPTPQKDHNDDPDISYRDGIYSIVYLETVRPEYQNIMLLQSSDRINWTNSVLFHEKLSELQGIFTLSPAIIYHNNECYMFAVKCDYKNGHSFFYVKGKSITELDFSTQLCPKFDFFPKKQNPWHTDVFSDNANGYIMLISFVKKSKTKKNKYTLYYAHSKDLKNWNLCSKPIIKNCYRSTGFVKNGILYIYFSSNYFHNKWKTGLYKIKL